MRQLQKITKREFKVANIIIFVASLAVLSIVLRVVPHTANIAPVGALALLSGAVLSRRAGIFVPVIVMIVADLIIGLHSTVLFTWLGFGMVGLFGSLLAKRSVLSRIGLGALGSAAIFYLISNFGVWLITGMYAHTLTGLIECYTMALPFLRASFMGDLAFATAFFGVYAVLRDYLDEYTTISVTPTRSTSKKSANI